MSNWGVEHGRLRAPREDRTALIEPPFDRVADMVEENLRLGNGRDYDLQGRSLGAISQLARAELLTTARQWTAAYRDIPSVPPDPQGRIYLAGHQPQMFHPGVWFKNFALGELARRHGATAINLVIDNDILAEATLRVPGQSVADPRVEHIAFDRPDPKIPYEERRIEDRELFGTFDRRVREHIAPLVADPLIGQYWPLVRRGPNTRIGWAPAWPRPGISWRGLPGAWRLSEVPQSSVCTSAAFQWFVTHLLAQLPRFHAVHNAAVREYRRKYHVRSTSHPVPELAAEGTWLEAPFWVWTALEPRRRRLFARAAGD